MNLHPTAIIEPGAKIGADVEIGPWCFVGAKVSLGAGTRLISHVRIEGSTVLGKLNTVHPFAVVGGTPQDLKYNGEDTELVIGDGNTIRECVTLNKGTVQGGGMTRIGHRNLIMAYVHVGHDCVVGDETVIANSVNLAGHVVVETGAVIGGMVAVVQFRRVGTAAYVGAQCGVTFDVPPFTTLRYRSEIAGANIVGLRRRGLAPETIRRITEAVNLWRRPDLQKEACLLEIERQGGDCAEVRRFVEFIRSSEHGVSK